MGERRTGDPKGGATEAGGRRFVPGHGMGFLVPSPMTAGPPRPEPEERWTLGPGRPAEPPPGAPGEAADDVPAEPARGNARPAGHDADEPAAVAVMATPVGPLHAAATREGIVGLELRTTDEAFAASVRGRTRRAVVVAGDERAPDAARAHLALLERQLEEHFAGVRAAFDVPVVLEGMSSWDRRVLEGVRTIPRGATASYGEVARRIGAPGAARAVGGAVGRNPIGFLVPCHRVVAGDGTLGGYGGSWFGSRDELLRLKERLLELEGVTPPPRSTTPERRRR